jgi:hypothetical protein
MTSISRSKAGVTDTDEAARYRLLVEQLRDEWVEKHGQTHGWKEVVAARLDVSGAFVGMVESGKKRGGTTSINKARKRLGIHRDFFYDPGLGKAPYYGDHMAERASANGAEPAHWAEFVERYEHLAAFSDDDLSEIKRFAARKLRIRSWTDWERLAEMVRTSKPSPTFEKK